MNTAKFISSFFDYKKMPDNEAEVAFIGRSNVGKSSLINFLTATKNIAKVSSTPGKTQCINLFSFQNKFLVDLPGYGYAAQGKQNNIFLSTMVRDYLMQRKNLKLIFVLIDCRIPIQKLDLAVIQLLETYKKNFSIIITKVDKISNNALFNFMTNFEKTLAEIVSKEILCYTSSAEKKLGREDILNAIIESYA
ncbi:MAG: ribosome biogenesis GTP-binding protein YihA/YsxC [Cytophagales bacterium]|jgi:GTP-binding protein|nr:ribosome biogenesis GTP-binding protein YihA/YsxC [Cytophagales bacterium]